MEAQLKQIITVSNDIRSSIDTDLLKKNTVYAPLSFLEHFRWDHIRHLYILGHSGNCTIETLKDDTLERPPYFRPHKKYFLSKKSSFIVLLRPGCYLNIDETWMLVIGAPQAQIGACVSRCTDHLEQLTAVFTDLETLDVGHLTNLQLLDLQMNDRLSRLEHLNRLHFLQELNLTRTPMGAELDLNGSTKLHTLNIDSTKISTILLDHTLPELRNVSAKQSRLTDSAFLQYLPALETLSIDNTPITNLDPLRYCQNLVSLRAPRTHLTVFPPLGTHKRLVTLILESALIEDLDHVIFPPNLETLSLANTRTRRIPDGIRTLSKLKHLNLKDLSLEKLPSWLPELGLDFCRTLSSQGINLAGTTIKGIDMRIFDQPRPFIRNWLEEWKKANDGMPLNELKVVFLGDGGAGKSYTIARLLADGGQPEAFSGSATPGIVITDKHYRIGDRDVQIHFWDFGGQEILHSMHRMFLTDRTLYVVVLNVRDGTQDERARYWLHNIKSFAGDTPVLVVLNQMDENPNASINEIDLHHMAPGMTEVVKISALRDSPDKFNATFTAALLRQVGRMSSMLDFFFPASWAKVKHCLQTMKTNYIRGDHYAALCEACGVANERTLQKALLEWFNDLGISFCYGDCQLEDYVILRPDWLTNAIYIILFNKLDGVRNGIVPLQSIDKVLNPDSAGRDQIRRVLHNVTYDTDEVSYVLNVIRKFGLSFQLNKNEEFIPMLCDCNSLPIAAEYESDPNTLEFRMEYDYLPHNVLHRLIAMLRNDLDMDNVWLTGAHFAQKSTGLSAVVKTEGNALRIFVRSSNPSQTPNTYLSTIKDTLDHINRDMGLAKPYNLVVYKADGISEEFDYDDLIYALEDGEKTYRSRCRRKRIPIADILNQTGHVADTGRERFIRSLVAACRSMQCQKLYWNLPNNTGSTESIRNDFIALFLRGKGYIVYDQTRSGAAAGGKQSGGADLDIRLQPAAPWTLLDSLNIRRRPDRVNWDRHLHQLLDRCNVHGLPFLFLISYLECGKEDFHSITDAYDEHMHWYDPPGYERLPNSFAALPVQDAPYIRMAKCTYDCRGLPTTVYHICVRLGD